MQSSVYEHTDAELDCGNYETADKTAQYQAVGLHIDVNQINQKKRNTARNRHCPMRVASCHNLNEAVNYGTEAENREIFAKINLI